MAAIFIRDMGEVGSFWGKKGIESFATDIPLDMNYMYGYALTGQC